MIDHITEIPLPGRTLTSHVEGVNDTAGVALPAFVAGPENRLVAATISRLIQPQHGPETIAVNAPPQPIRPTVLSLFGGSGTGKSQLARGLVRHWQITRGEESADYVTAQDFRRQFSGAMDADAVVEFRRRTRSRELLAIDDVHRLPTDDYLLQELRYTLDAMEVSGGMIVVTSTRAVSTLANLSPDVRARLACGLTLQLAPPGSAARLRIVRQVATALHRRLSDDAVKRLATSLRGTANDLVGALFELCAELPPGHIANSEQADRLLAARAARRPALQEIVAVVAKYYKMSQKQLRSKSRKQSAVFPRATAVFLARELTDASYEQIGQALGGRDHTTIMHNYQKIERELERDAAVQEAVEDLRRILLSS